MKLFSALFSLLLLLSATSADSAYVSFKTKNRLTKYIDGSKHTERRWQNHIFRVQVISDREGHKKEHWKNGRPIITAEKDERYAVRLYNPLPVRVAVNLTVDGINTITGKPSGISDGKKWIIRPNGSITIRGWQVGNKDLRRFFFTEKPKSYAKWRSKDFDQDLSVNCGVIGAAFFWNKKELQRYYDRNPEYIYTHRDYSNDVLGEGDVVHGRAIPGKEMKLKPAPMAKKIAPSDGNYRARKEKAGTGMGEREHHAVHEVRFKYDTGMYKLSQAVLIYYDFAEEPTPNPFPGLSFAPEMPY